MTVADPQSEVSENPAFEAFTIPLGELVERAAVRRPGQLCAKFENWGTTQASYRNGITLYFTDQWNDLQLCEHEPLATMASQASSESVQEFISQTTIESSDSVLEFNRIHQEYESWLGAGTVSQNLFAKHLQSTGYETVKQATDAGRQTLIQGRKRRFLSSSRITTHGLSHF